MRERSDLNGNAGNEIEQKEDTSKLYDACYKDIMEIVTGCFSPLFNDEEIDLEWIGDQVEMSLSDYFKVCEAQEMPVDNWAEFIPVFGDDGAVLINPQNNRPSVVAVFVSRMEIIKGIADNIINSEFGIGMLLQDSKLCGKINDIINDTLDFHDFIYGNDGFFADQIVHPFFESQVAACLFKIVKFFVETYYKRNPGFPSIDMIRFWVRRLDNYIKSQEAKKGWIESTHSLFSQLENDELHLVVKSRFEETLRSMYFEITLAFDSGVNDSNV